MDKKTKKQITIQGEKVPVKHFERYGFCMTEATVGTNGFQGGDWGYGSRTYLRLNYCGGGVFDIRVRGTEENRVLEIKAGGDDELKSVIENLSFALETLKEMSGYTPKGHNHE